MMGPEYFFETVIYGLLPEFLSDEELGKIIKALSDPEGDEVEYDFKDDKLNCIYHLSCLLKTVFK